MTTTLLIALLAAGMAAQAVAFLEQAEMVTALGDVCGTRRASVGRQPAGQGAAYAVRLHRPAERDAARRSISPRSRSYSR